MLKLALEIQRKIFPISCCRRSVFYATYFTNTYSSMTQKGLFSSSVFYKIISDLDTRCIFEFIAFILKPKQDIFPINKSTILSEWFR